MCSSWKFGFYWRDAEWTLPDVSKNEAKDMLLECVKQCEKTPPFNINEIHEKIKSFPIKFPVECVRLYSLKERSSINSDMQRKLERNIKSTYPIMHERALVLMVKFLLHKRKHGSKIEKAIYNNMSILQFINRLLTRRAVSFFGSEDWYHLLSGEKGSGGWETIGTLEEKPPLILKNCLSYDELKIFAMIYVSGYTECTQYNDGARDNNGCVDSYGENHGVIIGLIGPRFVPRFQMDFQDIILVRDPSGPKFVKEKPEWSFFSTFFQSEDMRKEAAKDDLREIWEEFYQSPTMNYYELSSNHVYVAESDSDDLRRRFRYLPGTSDTEVFDNLVYYKRIQIIAETLLIEADNRAKECGRDAFVNVVGCGLGNGLVSDHQPDFYVIIFINTIISFLEEGLLNHVTDINFAYIEADVVKTMFSDVIKEYDGNPIRIRKAFFTDESHPKGGINVQIQNRESSSKLTEEHEGKLLVMTYPADSNSLPGNEFWQGSLNTSGGAAAASSTQISELHNPHINPAVHGNNVRVVGKHGLKTLSEYCVVLASTE